MLRVITIDKNKFERKMLEPGWLEKFQKNQAPHSVRDLGKIGLDNATIQTNCIQGSRCYSRAEKYDA